MGVSTYMASHQLLTGGHAAQLHTFAQRVKAIGERLGDVPLQVVAQYYLVIACHLAGDYRGTEDLCRKLMQALQGERSREQFGLARFPAVQSRGYLARALAERGVFDGGDAWDTKPSGWRKRWITRTASSGHVWGSRIWTASEGK
jgi:hypothetical protein